MNKRKWAGLALGALLTAGLLLKWGIGPEQSRMAVGQMDAGPQVVLDPGHGGMDGGAVSAGGLQEKDLNLAIARKTRMLLRLTGTDAVMTRDGDVSLEYKEGETVRRNKQNDLRARAETAARFPESVFISIHMNQFEQSQYRGAQVFYGRNGQSQRLAGLMQQAFRQALDPENNRQPKPAPDSVYIMKKIQAPAVIAECGFLSNPQEAALLSQPDYQKKIALAITGAYLQFAGQEEERKL